MTRPDTRPSLRTELLVNFALLTVAALVFAVGAVLLVYDQADPARGLISWTSPLGNALMGAKRGASVVWQRPMGDVTITIVDVGSRG